MTVIPAPTCIYCGLEPGITQDHVPPKSLFPKPRPHLVTVPCCESCRRLQSLDDDYLRTVLALRSDVATQESNRLVVEATHRALSRPEFQGLITSLLRTVREVEIGTGGTRGSTFTVDVTRLDTVMRRTLLGLYFHETLERLPDMCGAVVYCLDAFRDLEPALAASLDQLVTYARAGQIKRIGDGAVFTYRYQPIADMPGSSLWMFLLYNHVQFVGYTARNEDLPARKRNHHG